VHFDLLNLIYTN